MIIWRRVWMHDYDLTPCTSAMLQSYRGEKYAGQNNVLIMYITGKGSLRCMWCACLVVFTASIFKGLWLIQHVCFGSARNINKQTVTAVSFFLLTCVEYIICVVYVCFGRSYVSRWKQYCFLIPTRTRRCEIYFSDETIFISSSILLIYQ